MTVCSQVPSLNRAPVRRASAAVGADVTPSQQQVGERKATTLMRSRTARGSEPIRPHPAQRRRTRAPLKLLLLLGLVVSGWATAAAARRSRSSPSTAVVPSPTVTGIPWVILGNRTWIRMITVLLLVDTLASGTIAHATKLATSCASWRTVTGPSVTRSSREQGTVSCGGRRPC